MVKCPDEAEGRRNQLERPLDCAGSRNIFERRACFVEILRLFERWPPEPGRFNALRHASETLARRPWHASFLSAPSSLVVNTETRAARDTLDLAWEVVDAYPDDTTRDTSAASKIILASPNATELESLVVRNATFSLEALAQGPGASKLFGLTIHDSLGTDVDWQVLADCSGWQTLQGFLLTNTHVSVALDPALWKLLDDATDLHELDLSGCGSATVVERLAQHPRLCRRLERLDLKHCNLHDEAVDELGRNPYLDGLIRLELRQNSPVTRDAIARLRSVPRLSKTEILGP